MIGLRSDKNKSEKASYWLASLWPYDLEPLPSSHHCCLAQSPPSSSFYWWPVSPVNCFLNLVMISTVIIKVVMSVTSLGLWGRRLQWSNLHTPLAWPTPGFMDTLYLGGPPQKYMPPPPSSHIYSQLRRNRKYGFVGFFVMKYCYWFKWKLWWCWGSQMPSLD